MAIINLIEPENATGKVAEIYETMNRTMGFIPNAFKVFSSSEHVLDGQVSNMGYFMRHKTLGGKFLALTRLLVSEKEQCSYCVGVNSRILLQYGILPDELQKIKEDPSQAPLEPAELALLLFVLKVVKDSNSILPEDMKKLHELGWNDRDILDATYHAAMQTGTDKIFNAFKIEVDM